MGLRQLSHRYGAVNFSARADGDSGDSSLHLCSKMSAHPA